MRRTQWVIGAGRSPTCGIGTATLDSRYTDYHVTLMLQEGSQIQAGVNPTVENLLTAFTVNNRRGVRIAPGRQSFNEHFVLLNGDPSAALSPIARFSTGEFYDGEKRDSLSGDLIDRALVAKMTYMAAF